MEPRHTLRLGETRALGKGQFSLHVRGRETRLMDRERVRSPLVLKSVSAVIAACGGVLKGLDFADTRQKLWGVKGGTDLFYC